VPRRFCLQGSPCGTNGLDALPRITAVLALSAVKALLRTPFRGCVAAVETEEK
jgi:hypothetical protein